MDISDTIAPNSDQLDAIDLLTGPQTFTISKVSKGNPEQPVNIHLAEFDRPWRPGKSMRRVLVSAWGADASQYVGRRLTLWCDPTVRFGGVDVGGVRISHLSHIDKPKSVPLLITRGKSAMFTVRPLVEGAKPVVESAPMMNRDAITKAQLARLAELFRELDMNDRTETLAYVSGIVGREVDSTKSLTDRQADMLISTLEAAVENGGAA